METPPPPAAPPATPAATSIQLKLLLAALFVAGLWVARSFILPIAWAIVLSIGLWPMYLKLRARSARDRPQLVALGLTLATGLLLMLPLVMIAVEAVRDSRAVIAWLTEVRHEGIPPPFWLGAIPLFGERLVDWWQSHLADPRAATESLGQVDAASVARWTAAAAARFASGAMFFFVTLLALFLLLRDGDRILDRTRAAAERLYGEFGRMFVDRLANTIRGTVNGTVLVALGEGLLIGVGYWLAGVPRPVLFTVATIAFALLPFGAWFAFGLASVVLLAQGDVVAALALFAFGAAVMLVGDNLVQPVLIGNAVELPFLWTLVATFGGIESFGLVGLFLGPALIAALFLVWKEWLGETTAPG